MDVSFVKSAFKINQYPPPDRSEIAFAGKSNVGKSSLINTLVNRKNLVRTSSSPGRTQMLNFFRINNQVNFVDFPGYGYAKVPLKVRAQWKPMVESYLKHRTTLQLVIILIDIRRVPGSDDSSLIRWLEKFDIPFLIVLTKTDKLSQNKCSAQQKIIQDFLLLQREEVICFSAVTKKGRQEILKRIMSVI